MAAIITAAEQFCFMELINFLEQINSNLLELIGNNDNHTEILVAGTAFAGTVLAIFFTLISIPLQNILSRYSQDLIKRLTGDAIFISAFISLGFIFVFNAALLSFGTNRELVWISFGLDIEAVLILALLLVHTFYKLDARNQVKDMFNGAKRLIKTKLTKSESRRKEEIERFQKQMKEPLTANVEQVLRKFQVEDSVTDWLKSEIDLPIDVIQRAVLDNRFEVVESGLHDLVGLVNAYIIARKDYTSEDDALITYVREKLIDVKNLIGKDTHPKITLAVARTARDIAIDSLKISPVRTFAGENFIPLGFVNILRDICISQELLKETSYAPMSTIEYLVDIAKEAVDRGFPNTVPIVVDKIGEIGRLTTKLHLSFTDFVAGKANWGLAAVLDYLFIRMEEMSKFNPKLAIKTTLEEIDKNIKTYLEDDEKYQYTLRSNIKPFFGPFSVEQHGIASVFVRALQQPRKDKRVYSYVLEALEDFLVDLNQNVMAAMNKGLYIDVKEMLEHVYMIGMSVLGLVKMTKDQRLKEELINLLEKHFEYPFTNAISMSFKYEERKHIFDHDYLDTFTSLIGLGFFQLKDNDRALSILQNWIEHLVEIIDTKKKDRLALHEGKKYPKPEIVNPLSELYRHLRLNGVWLLKFAPKSKLLVTVLKELKEQPSETIRDGIYGYRNPYPEGLTGRGWHVRRPYLPFRPKFFMDADKALYDPEYIKKFEEKLSKLK
ncbi:MAG: hypothetical protein WD231_04440 [Candidatus Woykebacteria bacterium]